MNSPREIREGEMRPPKDATPVLRVEIGGKTRKFHRNEEVPCKVYVEVPDGGRMPEVVNISIRKKTAIFAGPHPATPIQRDERKAILELRILAPKEPGKYSVQAEGLNTLITQSTSDRPKFESKWTMSPGIDIEVEK